MNRQFTIEEIGRLVLLVPLLTWLVPLSTTAQTVGTCRSPLSFVYLNVNNVSAGVRNSGNLFHGSGYEVPIDGNRSSIFSAYLLIEGLVDGEYAGVMGNWEYDEGFWSGPVFPGSTAPPNCDQFDRIYKIDRDDLDAFEAGEAPATDLREWPTGLGAPTLDADGNSIVVTADGTLEHRRADGSVAWSETLPFEQRIARVIDLDGGERPDLLGDQMLWWVMNDLGGPTKTITALPVGLEVHGTAFAFNVPGPLSSTTFYRFRVLHKGPKAMKATYAGMFFDADLGRSLDDYVGVDTLLGLGYNYNADNDDEGPIGYGSAPPAVGVDFFRGPLVDTDGKDNDRDGVVDEPGERLQMTAFKRAIRQSSSWEQDPVTAEEYYNVLQGRFKDGVPMTVGGEGRDFSTQRTTFQFSGAADNGEFWSQNNTDGNGTEMTPYDTRFFTASGPFEFAPMDEQEIVFGIVWARGTDNLDSVRLLKANDAFAQAAFDVGFRLAPTPSAPRVTATSMDGQVVLEWSNRPTDNNYMDAYREPVGLSPGEYVFEGYRVYQYESPLDTEGTLLATYDVINGITRVIDGIPGEPTEVVAAGEDSGLRHQHVVDELINYQTYYFGVQAYAYNETALPKIYASPVTRIEVEPTRIEARAGGSRLQADLDADVVATLVEGATDGWVRARVTNPTMVTGHEYVVRFFADSLASGGDPIVNYDVVDGTTGETLHNGFEARRLMEKRRTIESPSEWIALSQRPNVLALDGLELSVEGPSPGLKGFITVANAAGPLDPPDMAAFAFNASGFPIAEETGLIPPGSHPNSDRPTAGYQQSSNNSVWGIHTGGGGRLAYGNDEGPFNAGNTFVGRSLRDGWGPVVPDDFEWRFTQDCLDRVDGVVAQGDCLGFKLFDDGSVMEVPFEVWNTGPDDDPSDDYRMIPVVCDSACGFGPNNSSFGLSDAAVADHAISGGANDPYTDWVYFYAPEDNGANPGEQGYYDFFFGSAALGQRTFSRLVLVNWNGGSARPYTAELPEPGTVFRIVSRKPNVPGVVFSLDTAGLEVITGDEQVARSALDEIGIVPNPYRGASAYEVDPLADEVRFTNLPPQATIRIFDLAGSLVRRLDKNSADPMLRWNLRTDEGLPIASGMYYVHVEVDGLGERALKFAVVRRGTRLHSY